MHSVFNRWTDISNCKVALPPKIDFKFSFGLFIIKHNSRREKKTIEGKNVSVCFVECVIRLYSSIFLHTLCVCV